MARFFIELSYDGTNYHGWQAQPNAVTVQQTLEEAMSVLLKDKIEITGCGRTDTGVHASFFTAHFDSEQVIPDETDDLMYRLNCFLPNDIAIHAIYAVNQKMHARFSATYRQYRYSISISKPVFNRLFSYYYFGRLNVELMNQACEIVREYTDFTSFSKLHTDVKTNNCTIMEAQWKGHEHGYDFEIKADRFLRNMVRSIVGTMLEVGSGKMTLSEFRDVIEARDRGRAGMSAPAKGLVLTDVGY